MRLLALLALPGCTYHVLTSVQVEPSTRPLNGDYQLGLEVEAHGCDDGSGSFSVADLVSDARGDADALVNVTIEHTTTYNRTWWNPLFEVLPTESCFRVQGNQARLLPPAPAPTVSVAEPQPAP